MDLYGDDIDTILGTDVLNENIDELASNRDENNGSPVIFEDDLVANDRSFKADGSGDEGEANKSGKVVEPKRRTVRNPQLRLNVERLKCDRGIHKIEDYFKDIHFLGKGYEKQDLDNVMKRMEHWAHRLYPKYNFDDFIATTEKLTKKKQLQTHMSRYRLGMLEPDDKPVATADSDDDNNEGAGVAEPIFDEFDDLIGQQIEKYRTLPPKTPTHDATFNSLRSSVIGTPTFMNRIPVVASTPMSPCDFQPLPSTPVHDSASAKLSAEQMARIAENRRIAQERLKAKKAAAVTAPQTSSEENTSIENYRDLIDTEDLADIL